MERYPLWLQFLVNSAFEEFLFRGTLLYVLLFMLNPVYAIIISALIFGIVHIVLFNWIMVLIAFIGGLIFGYVYWITGGTILSIWLCIALHMVFVRFMYGRGLFKKLARR